MSGTVMREQILTEARSWIGTPYCHQASRKNAGCDCLGLVRGVWREIYGQEPLSLPPYTSNWAEECGEETLLNAAIQCLVPIPNEDAKPGDIILFRMRPNAPCKHMAILSGPTTMIHAYWGRAVTESHMVPYWKRRWAFSFAFPNLKET